MRRRVKQRCMFTIRNRTALAVWDLIAGRLVCPFGPRLRVPYLH